MTLLLLYCWNPIRFLANLFLFLSIFNMLFNFMTDSIFEAFHLY